ncbi:hypothetical protein K3495_g8509 [Podosphaera aphanis]|nr:hypothetical protein K3495_g8509 [Podosphaera aphanis]
MAARPSRCQARPAMRPSPCPVSMRAPRRYPAPAQSQGRLTRRESKCKIPSPVLRSASEWLCPGRRSRAFPPLAHPHGLTLCAAVTGLDVLGAISTTRPFILDSPQKCPRMNGFLGSFSWADWLAPPRGHRPHQQTPATEMGDKHKLPFSSHKLTRRATVLPSLHPTG